MGGVVMTIRFKKECLFIKKENTAFFHLKITLSHPYSLITKETKTDSL